MKESKTSENIYLETGKVSGDISQKKAVFI